MSSRTEKAAALFAAGCNCSQAVVVAFSDLFGLDEKTAMKFSCGHGAGLGRQREVCGAVSGMAMLAGLKHGSERPDDREAKARTYEAVQALSRAFRDKHGSIICRDLLGLEGADSDPTPAPRTAGYYRKRPCAEYVRDAAALVEQTLL